MFDLDLLSPLGGRTAGCDVEFRGISNYPNSSFEGSNVFVTGERGASARSKTGKN